ncbi:acyltransferase family protein [Asanoa iriomotensis]|uniref:Membrane protein n=1 Tax=Asanoa iriomotensis TaxID=234613 RepID=A0ABQ4CEZ0_9ACTN|nr:acyltransferase family protein [Asanoa iriomotensis]GIF61336.1 membrane protein [Asanoa iriomotensis]
MTAVEQATPWDETAIISKVRRPEPPTPPAVAVAAPGGGRGRQMFFPAVDGLRGLAILSVLLYHTSWFSNGLFGVDVFMVLSGFLITLLLIREAKRTGRIALGDFFRRRFKRLMPGLSITLLVTVALAYVLGGLKEAEQISGKAIASLFQVANWQQIRNSDAYWEGFGRINPLAHMWSLSITEQFYVVWPFVFLLVFWLCRRSVVALTCVLVLLLVASAAVAPLMYDGTNSDRLYLGTETRAVDFVAGAVAAGFAMLLYGRSAERRHGRGPSASSTFLATFVGVITLAALVGVSLYTSDYHEAWLYQGGIAGVAVITAVLIVTLCHERGPLVRVLSFGPLAEIGRISYTMYLLHLPIFWIMQKSSPTITPYALFLIGGLLTWVGAMLMHYTLTERIRLRPWKAVRAVPTALVLTLAIVGGAWYLPAAAQHRMNPGGRPPVLLLGDSLAGDFAEALVSDGRDRYGVVDGSISGCGISGSAAVRPVSGKIWPETKECAIRSTLWRESLRQAEPVLVVAHFGWDAADQFVNGAWTTPCDPAYSKLYKERLDLVVREIRAEVSAPILIMNEQLGTYAAQRSSIACYNKIIEEYAAAGGVSVLDFNGMLCPDKGKKCRDTDAAGKPLSVDGVHFTPEGKAFVAPLLEDLLTAALAPTPTPTK